MAFDKIAFRASETPEAQQTLKDLAAKYGDHDAEGADVIVAIGGDGLMLQILHENINLGLPIYGINRGSVGFLMNDLEDNDLKVRLASAEPGNVHPLSMNAIDRDGNTHSALAINEHDSATANLYKVAKPFELMF